MNSKEALELLKNNISDYLETIKNNEPTVDKIGFLYVCLLYEIIKQDLEKLEKLKKKNKRLLVNKNVAQGIAIKLKEENDKLKKALDKACERLEESCPVDQELVEDLDCDECNNNCKECWKKYFMKEVLGNENN